VPVARSSTILCTSERTVKKQEGKAIISVLNDGRERKMKKYGANTVQEKNHKGD